MSIKSAAYLTVLLAIWLAASAFMWHRADGQLVTTLAVAGVTLVSALLSIHRPPVRFVATAAGAVLSLSALALHRITSIEALSNVLAGLAIIALSLLAGSPRMHRHDRIHSRRHNHGEEPHRRAKRLDTSAAAS